jgi:endonuclease YncB( thermonuclease family)
MSFVLSLLGSTLGRTAAIAAVCFVAGAIVCWRWTHREARTFSDSFHVTSVENGATIAVQAGVLGRRSRLVMLQGVTAPGLNDPLGRESQSNLAGLAGETVRVESHSRSVGAATIVGTCYGATNADLALAQLRAGLATCETAATKPQLAAQKEAQKARRGLWAAGSGSHWWHFNLAATAFPEALPEEKETSVLNLDYGLILEIAVVAIVLLWIVWSLFGAAIVARVPTAAAVGQVVDTSEQLACYAALTGIRHASCVANDPQAVQYCEYLRTVCTAWKTPAQTT